MLGFLIALVAGIALAVGIVHVRTLDRSLMPWLIASQAMPVLAIAPMVVVVLGNIGLTGVLPKALIAGWLSFFPITTGMVKGLRSLRPMQRDLLRTYSATDTQVFAKLRWPASMAFLFPAMKVAAPLALVGAIVAELPTGAQAGLGARLLTGSYYGQTLQIWAALFMAAFLAVAAVALVDARRPCWSAPEAAGYDHDPAPVGDRRSSAPSLLVLLARGDTRPFRIATPVVFGAAGAVAVAGRLRRLRRPLRAAAAAVATSAPPSRRISRCWQRTFARRCCVRSSPAG